MKLKYIREISLDYDSLLIFENIGFYDLLLIFENIGF